MDNPKKIDIFDEAMRLVFLHDGGTAAGMSAITSHTIIPMPAGKKDLLLDRLEKLMHTLSFGQLLQRSMAAQQLDARALAKTAGLPDAVITDLINDTTYTNNVPVKLFRQLLVQLNLSFEQVKAAVLKTFDLLQTSTVLKQPSFGVFEPAFRKGYYAAGEPLAKTTPASDGRELFENRESLNRYLDRLNELMQP